MWRLSDLLIFPAPVMNVVVLDQIADEVGAKPFRFQAEDGVPLYGWHRPSSGRRAVLFFHGNAETVADRVALQDWLHDIGWDVFIVAYRGYPGSGGSPSEDGLRLDALALWRYVTETRKIPANRVVLHGKSLGGGVAAMLAAEVKPGGVVLESTFTAVVDVAAERLAPLPVGPFIRSPFLTRERAPRIAGPILVLHADQDVVIPVSHGRTLGRMFADRGRYVEVAGLGHGETLPIADPTARDAYRSLLYEVDPYLVSRER